MPDRVGLCLRCSNVKVVLSDRGSVFYCCRLSFVDPRFVKYPVLPVLTCDGYMQASHQNLDDAESRAQ